MPSTRNAEWQVKAQERQVQEVQFSGTPPQRNLFKGLFVFAAILRSSRRLHLSGTDHLENDKDSYDISVSSARWITIELMHRLFFKRQV